MNPQPASAASNVTEALRVLSAIPHLEARANVPLSAHTRFEIGGPAQLFVDARTPASMAQAVAAIDHCGLAKSVIGGGSNLVVNDAGFAGAILRYVANEIEFDGVKIVVAAGAILQDLVDGSIGLGLRGLHTMTGIPGWLGGAIYGNAGAYGNSIHQYVESVRFFDGAKIQEISNQACEFDYRESVFKRRKDWIIVSATLHMEPGDRDQLSDIARDIRKTRDAKYPPSMRCAGSIFKNLLAKNLPPDLLAQVPAGIVREGKIPSAYFLEAAGAKGQSNGAIRVADYHANLLYNTGGGTADEVRALVDELKGKVRARFGIMLEEEVQYI